MNKNKISLDRYLIIKTIGKGGMGEVYLAYDPICKRNIALKKIRSDLADNETIKHRFLKEAKIAGRLTHPCIIPIYSIHIDQANLYYTMPYVEGKMLKNILIDARENIDIQNGEGSISNLIRIFLSVCEAVAYTHSKHILHRDLKPGNVIIGKYGEVLILDWGIADFITEKEPSAELSVIEEDEKKEITLPGKIAGTIAFMAPERIFGEKADVLTDIYSLGVILYQILTLSSPFKRLNVKHFKKIAKTEKFIDPEEQAPYRNIPYKLSEICKKCLSYKKEDRYQSVNELIKDIIDYIEGKPEWLFFSNLDLNDQSDWDVNENIFLPKQTAIANNNPLAEWVSFLLAKKPVSGNIKIEADVTFKKSSKGLGFLLSMPDTNSKLPIEEGYFLWLGFNKAPFAELFRSNAGVAQNYNLTLDFDKPHHILIEKQDNNFICYLNNKLILKYTSHLPMSGTRLGLIYKDQDFEINNIKIYSSIDNIMVNCLAIPDAFLEKKDYDNAYKEYKQIARSFPGRAEEMQALFKAGTTILEKAKETKDHVLYQKALEEFDNLHHTSGAPLEYLGKSLTYASLLEFEEEAKCLELAVRKFHNHPLLSVLTEHILYRIQESSQTEREAAYRLILLSFLHIPSLKTNKNMQELIENLTTHWEKIYFIITNDKNKTLPIELAYRLNKKHTLLELLLSLQEEKTDKINLYNVLFALLEIAPEELKKISDIEKYPVISILSKIKSSSDIESSLQKIIKNNSKEPHFFKALIYLFKLALDKNLPHIVEKHFEKLSVPPEDAELFDSIFTWAFLLKKDYKKAEEILKKYSVNRLSEEDSPLCPLYGIWLYVTKSPEKAMAYFSGILEMPYPKTPALLSHYLTEKIDRWFNLAFFWEKNELYRELFLFYHCKNDPQKETYFAKLSQNH